MQIKRAKITSPQQRFVRLMDFYEQNYIYLRKLIPEIDNISGRAVSVKRNSIDLHLQILEKEKFTTTLLLTHFFKAGNRVISKPDFIVRVYHDARSAEVMSASLQGHKVQLAQSKTGVRERYRLNRFLLKWLQYSLKQGHSIRKPVMWETFKHYSDY